MPKVTMARWPDDRETASSLIGEGVGVLYLVSDNDEPPRAADCLVDWIRLPGDERDIRARLETLELRTARHRQPPWLDTEARLHYRGVVVPLSRDEAALAAIFAASFGQLVADADFAPILAGTAASLRMRVAQLRAKLRQLDLAIERIRGRGYRLQGL